MSTMGRDLLFGSDAALRDWIPGDILPAVAWSGGQPRMQEPQAHDSADVEAVSLVGTGIAKKNKNETNAQK